MAETRLQRRNPSIYVALFHNIQINSNTPLPRNGVRRKEASFRREFSKRNKDKDRVKRSESTERVREIFHFESLLSFIVYVSRERL